MSPLNYHQLKIPLIFVRVSELRIAHALFIGCVLCLAYYNMVGILNYVVSCLHYLVETFWHLNVTAKRYSASNKPIHFIDTRRIQKYQHTASRIQEFNRSQTFVIVNIVLYSKHDSRCNLQLKCSTFTFYHIRGEVHVNDMMPHKSII